MPPAPSMPSAFIDAPDSISRMIHTDTKITVWPKSGCIISSTAIEPTTPAEISAKGSPGFLARSENSHAIATTNKGFRNSDGWRRAGPPNEIQRVAPLVVLPTTGTSASRTKKIAAPISAPRRATFCGNIETPIMIGPATTIQPSCIQK